MENSTIKTSTRKLIGKLAGSTSVILLLLSLVASCAAASEGFCFEPQEAVLTGIGSIETLDLYLDQVPSGLSGYNLTLSISNSSVARITGVEFPTWASLYNNSGLPGGSAWIKAVDLNEKVNAGDSNVLFCTVTVESLAKGETNLTVSVNRLDDDNENSIPVSSQDAKLTVGGPIVSILPADVTLSPNTEQVFEIRADKFPEGLSGYDFNLTLGNPDLGKFTGLEFPSWVAISENSSLPAASVNLRAVDYAGVQPGAENVLLAKVTFLAGTPEESELSLTFKRLDDDSGNQINAILEPSSVKVLESDWLQFQKDSSHSGYSYTLTPTMDPEVLWQNLTSPDQEPCGSGGINVPPVISGNKVFVTAGNASVWAFDKDSGETAWFRELGGALTQTSTPVLGDGKLFVPTLEGDLYAFDLETGAILWNTHITDRNFECPLTYCDHKLYIGEGLEGGVANKYYYCYDDNGNFIWKHETPDTSGFIWSGSVVVGDYIVYPVFEGKMVCLSKDTGAFIAEVNFSNSSDVSFALEDPGMFRSSVTYADGALYTSSERGQDTGYCFKVGFDKETGQFLNSGWAADIGFSTSTPSIYDGRVYVGHGEHGESGALFCLNASDGSVIWETQVSGGVKSSPVLAIQDGEPYIYFTEALSDGSVYCLNPDGTLAWHYNPPADDAYTLQGAALADGKVYYGTDSGYLYCIGQGAALAPVANFSSDKQEGFLPLNVDFKDESFNANEFLWDFGDGNTSTEVNPTHTYTTAGSYTVTLTVKNSHGEDTKVAEGYIYAAESPITWNVKNGDSIQAAIDAASPGDIINVYPGEYREVLAVNKTLTLKGIGGPVLNTSGFTGSSGVTIGAGGVEFSGFEIIGTEEMGFAIAVSATGTLIEDNVIDDCAEGVEFTGTGNILRENTISNCWDFAAVLDSAGGNWIYQNTFVNNNGRKTGGLSDHISGGAGSFFQSPEPVEYLWEGTKLTGYMGNYYDDYTGNDSTGDGIGDTAYTADAGIDNYPLVLAYSNYVEEGEHDPIPEDSWYQFHGKVDHLGCSESGPKTNRSEWVSEDIDAISSSSPVVAGGKVFVVCGASGMEGGTEDIAQLAALDEFTGEILWNVSIPETVYGSWASPTYDDGMVFSATGPELGCYDAGTGEKLWSFNDTEGSGGVVNSGPAIADGMVVFNDWDGSYYYCLDEYTGAKLWSFKVDGYGQSVPAYVDGKFYLTSWGYGTSYQGHAYCVDAVSGEQVWHINNVVESFCGSPAYKDGVLYLTTYSFYGNGDLFALNVSDGSIIWQQTIERSDSTPALAYGNVYVCGGSEGFSNVQTYCFNATTGTLVWETPSLTTEDGGIGGWTCSVAVADGLVYTGSEGEGYFGYSDLYALDAYTGSVVWHAPYAGSSPALSEGMLFSIGGDQKVYAFRDLPPVADFTANVTGGDAPLSVQFKDLSSNANSWLWDFGDGCTSTEQDPMHIYPSAGTYTVNLTVSNAAGNYSEVKLDYISVSEPLPPAPVAEFIANVTSGDAPLSVQFTDQSTGEGIVSWLWDFGDGTTSTEQNPAHSYAASGSYQVNFTVSNAGGSDSEVKVAYITVSEPLPPAPVAEFIADVTSGDAPLSVQFTDMSTGEGISSWFWDFGDGSSSTDQNPVHSYASSGSYSVNLTVNNAGGSDSEVKSNYISVSEPLPAAPVAEFIANVTSGYAPLSVQFTDQSTGDGIVSWLWDFGDGGTSTEQNPVHSYASFGSYGVNLTVSNAGGSDSEVKLDYISVSEPLPPAPVAKFTANVTSGDAPLSVQFTDQSTGEGIVSWLWDFGDGTNSTEQSPAHTYTAAGNYSVKLTVTNAGGSDEELKTDYITVSEAETPETGSEVSLNVTIKPAISLEVSPSALEFGELYPGKVSASQNVTLKNSGGCRIKVTAEVKDNLEGDDLFTRGIWLDSALWSSYFKEIESSSETGAAVSLHVPADYTGTGNKQGTITFWAEAA